MRAWFESLEAREQLIVLVGGVAAVLILLWALVWVPLDRAHDNARLNVDNWQRSLSELRSVAATVDSTPSGQAPAQDSGDSPVVVVDRSLRERGLNRTVKRQQPTPNGIRVEFENVAFDELVLWLGDLERQHAMIVQAGSLSLASRAGPGRINATLTLERTL